MDLEEMLKQHQLWLDKAHKSLTSAKAAPADLRQQRVEHIEARIADLTRIRDREVRRYDAAIAELNDDLAQLKAEPEQAAAQPIASAPPAAPAKPSKGHAPAKGKGKK